jgi:hypothetical protein
VYVDDVLFSGASGGHGLNLSIRATAEVRNHVLRVARDRTIVVGHFVSRRCGPAVGDLTVGFLRQPPGDEYVELEPIEGVPVWVERVLLPVLAAAGPRLRVRRPAFARGLAIDLDRPALWLDFLDRTGCFREEDPG